MTPLKKRTRRTRRSRPAVWRRWFWVSSGMYALGWLTLWPAGISRTALVWPCGGCQKMGRIRRNWPMRSMPSTRQRRNRYCSGRCNSIAMMRPAGSSWDSYPRRETIYPGPKKLCCKRRAWMPPFFPAGHWPIFIFAGRTPRVSGTGPQKAAQMDPDDAAPLFRLAWYVSPNAGEIASRLQIKRPLLADPIRKFPNGSG